MRHSKKEQFWKLHLVLILGVVAVSLPAQAQAEVKKSIAVAPIGFTSGTVSWISGEAIHAQLISELSESGRYRVVERENLEGILAEQDLAEEGRMRKGSGAKSGDLEGAQIMIKAMITDAEEESGKGGSAGFGGIRVGGNKTIYRVTMDVRIYDMQTGLILETATVTAEQEKKEKSGGLGVGGLSLGGSKSGGDTTGAITRDLIQQAIAALDKQADVIGWKSTVLSVKDDKIIILGGERDGLEPGMQFDVFKLGEPLIVDGEVLDEGEETKIGEIKLTTVKEKVSYATKVSGEMPEAENIAKLQKN